MHASIDDALTGLKCEEPVHCKVLYHGAAMCPQYATALCYDACKRWGACTPYPNPIHKEAGGGATICR